nr:uncharacterized protein LOC107439227 [Parasteatoda tepidariorum]
MVEIQIYGARWRPNNILPNSFMWIRDMILNIQPIWSVPLEISTILFIALNTYKSLYATDNSYMSHRLFVVGCTFITLLLETPFVTSFAILLLNFLLCFALSLCILWNANIAVLALPIYVSFSQPLSFLVDLIYVLRSAAFCVETDSEEFVSQTAFYSIMSSMLLITIDWESSVLDQTTVTVCFLLLHILSTLVYLFYYGTEHFRLRIQWAIFISFQLVINATIKHFYKGEKLTYSFQYFKSLSKKF